MSIKSLRPLESSLPMESELEWLRQAKAIARENGDQPRLRDHVPVEKAVEMLRQHAERGERVSQSRDYLTRRGKRVTVIVGMCRSSKGRYLVDWKKYHAGGSHDDKPYLDVVRELATFEEAVEWMENKTGIAFADCHR